MSEVEAVETVKAPRAPRAPRALYADRPDPDLMPIGELARILSASFPKAPKYHRQMNALTRNDLMKLIGMPVAKNLRKQGQRKALDGWLSGSTDKLTKRWHVALDRVAKLAALGQIEKCKGQIVHHDKPQREPPRMWNVQLETRRIGGRDVLAAKITPKQPFSAPKSMPRDFFGSGLFKSLKLPGEK